MDFLERFAFLFSLALLRYVPPVVLPSLSPLRWASPLVRIVLAIGLAWLTVLATPFDRWFGAGQSPLGWFVAAASELLIGFVFGLVVMIPQAALHMWGWVVDVQAGLSAVTLFNPGADGDMQSPMGAAIMLVATVLFFSLNLHLELYRALVASTQVILFPAPLSRRAIVGYKLFRAQLAILINALVFIFLMRRGIGFLPSGYRAISLWVLFTTLNFHRFGAALVRASWVEHQRHAFRRNVLPTLVLATVVFGVAVVAVDGWAVVKAVATDKGIFEAIGAARAMLEQRPASLVLWPVHALVAPVFATSRYEWVGSIPFAVLILLLHAWWVVRMDAAFEESAIAASYERVRRIDAWRSRRMTAPKTESISRRGLRIPTWGHPAVAIIWKNVLCLRRTVQLRVFIAPLIMAATWGWAFGTSHGRFAAIAVGALSLASLFTVFGPMLVRNDLRQDMQNLFALKVLPLRGRTIVLAEVMSSAIPIALLQFVVLIVAGIAARLMPDPIPLPVVATVLAAALPTLLAFASAMVAVMNGAPVLFPGWVRLGTVVGGGMENLGQGVLSMGIVLILVALLMVIPTGFVILSIVFLAPIGPALATFAAMVAGSAALGVETYGIFGLLGRALERTEPSEAAAA